VSELVRQYCGKDVNVSAKLCQITSFNVSDQLKVEPHKSLLTNGYKHTIKL